MVKIQKRIRNSASAQTSLRHMMGIYMCVFSFWVSTTHLGLSLEREFPVSDFLKTRMNSRFFNTQPFRTCFEFEELSLKNVRKEPRHQSHDHERVESTWQVSTRRGPGAGAELFAEARAAGEAYVRFGKIEQVLKRKGHALLIEKKNIVRSFDLGLASRISRKSILSHLGFQISMALQEAAARARVAVSRVVARNEGHQAACFFVYGGGGNEHFLHKGYVEKNKNVKFKSSDRFFKRGAWGAPRLLAWWKNEGNAVILRWVCCAVGHRLEPRASVRLRTCKKFR